VGNEALAVAARRPDHARARHLGQVLDVLAVPAKGEAKLRAGLHFAVVLHVRAAHADVEDQRILVVHHGQDRLRQPQALESASVAIAHCGKYPL
jgi:hypothetical protein